MKNLLFFLILLVSSLSWSQMGDVWPVDKRQDFDVDEEFQVINTYDEVVVCQFFMFINNNEFIHVTDNMTSLYKIISRDESVPDEPLYTVISEAGNQYTYIFNKTTQEVIAYSTKGFSIVFTCIAPHNTKVFANLNR
jgi:hypothetical protein